jgi:hypothetical protein
VQRTVVRDLAPSWDAGDCLSIVIADSTLGRRDAGLAFDEINERYRVDGIELQFDETEPGRLRAMFRAVPNEDAPRSRVARMSS